MFCLNNCVIANNITLQTVKISKQSYTYINIRTSAKVLFFNKQKRLFGKTGIFLNEQKRLKIQNSEFSKWAAPGFF